MSADAPVKNLRFDSPARYRIRVGGRIGPAWSDRLEGMQIRLASGREDPVVTTLLGELSDQAALAGLLRTLYELHLPLLSVVCLALADCSDTQQNGEMPNSEKED